MSDRQQRVHPPPRQQQQQQEGVRPRRSDPPGPIGYSLLGRAGSVEFGDLGIVVVVAVEGGRGGWPGRQGRLLLRRRRCLLLCLPRDLARGVEVDLTREGKC